MKKLTHIAAPVALTALLSACATPLPGPAEELRDQVEKVTTALTDQKEKLEALRFGLDELKVKDSPEVADSVSVYRKLTYTFKNLDAVRLGQTPSGQSAHWFRTSDS